jgi:hypothetical protein
MAKKLSKQSLSRQGDKYVNSTGKPRSSFLTTDAEIIPVHGNFGTSPIIKYPDEFAVLDALAVNQSATFPTERKGIISALRDSLKKHTEKRFVMRKIDGHRSRIWRLKDGTRLMGHWPRHKKDKKEKTNSTPQTAEN